VGVNTGIILQGQFSSEVVFKVDAVGDLTTAGTVSGTGNSSTSPGGGFAGFSQASGSGLNGTDGADIKGGNGDLSGGVSTTVGGAGATGNGGGGYGTGGAGVIGNGGESFDAGGAGVIGNGGEGEFQGGAGGAFTGASVISGIYGDGIDATNTGDGTFADTGAYAGNFTGDINVTGAIFAGTKDFKIDHPSDPANKYLVHASVESSEMMNIYTGNITTDGQGHATVQLPEWFEVLNTDFRYQLTVIGQFAQAIVAREIENKQFEIRTSAPNVKVSWLVTGVRLDAFAKAHPLVVEQEKEARVRGFYIHPELYGAPPEKQIEWARHPQMMKKLQAMQAKQLAAAQKQTAPRN
jgi:trimeric autotransporter adhesin